jgi:hypothetical protein
MATIAGIGRNTERASATAGRSAAAEARAALGGGTADLALVFASSGHDSEALLSAIRAELPGAALIGCSAEGVITAGRSDEVEHVVAVLAVRSDTLGFVTFLVPGYDTDSEAAGRELAARVRAAARGDELALFVLPDGLRGNAGALLAVLDRELPAGLRVMGGTAGEALTFERTFQYRDAEVATGAIAALLVRGRGRVEVAVSHGCMPIGLERRVTEAEGGWMRTIDGQPAWAVLREYLAGNPESLDTEAAIHLSIGEPLPADAARDYEPYIIRTPFAMDQASGAVFFPGGGLPQGGAIRLARRDPQRICDSARECASRIAERRPGEVPAFVLQFDCAGRGKQLFGSHVAEQIVSPLQEVLGREVPWIGFHTYGEIAPIGARTYYHNFTVALCAVYDTP